MDSVFSGLSLTRKCFKIPEELLNIFSSKRRTGDKCILFLGFWIAANYVHLDLVGRNNPLSQPNVTRFSFVVAVDDNMGYTDGWAFEERFSAPVMTCFQADPGRMCDDKDRRRW